MAVQERKNQEGNLKPKLDERFIMNLKGKDFVLYSGLLDLAHQKGLQNMKVEAVQYPTKDNGFEAICKATVESKSGEVFVELGDANPKNCNLMIVNHILRMAATRAKARALRDFTNIGMTCIDELAGPDDVLGDEKSGAGKSKVTEPGAKPETGNEANGKQTTSPANGNGNGTQAAASNGKSNGNATRPASSNGNGTRSANSSGAAKVATRSAKAGSKEEPANGNGQENSGPKPSTAQIKAIENLARRRNISAEELEVMVQQQFGTTLPNINSSEASNFIRLLQQSA